MQVVEYVQERASLYELTKSVRAWERKVEIAEVHDCVTTKFNYPNNDKVMCVGIISLHYLHCV